MQSITPLAAVYTPTLLTCVYSIYCPILVCQLWPTLPIGGGSQGLHYTHLLMVVQVVCTPLWHPGNPSHHHTRSPRNYYSKFPLDLLKDCYHQSDELLLLCCRNHLEYIRNTCSDCHTELHSGATR